MAIFTPDRAFRDATPVRCWPGSGAPICLPGAQPKLVATWSADGDGRLVRTWRMAPAALPH
jgi:hypothetical protein